MNGGCEYVGSGWWEVGVTLVRWDCWVLLGPGRGRRDDGGTEGAGRRLGAAGCVQSVGPMCSVLGAMCSVFGRMCSLSGAMCSFWRGRCSVFGGGRWLGIGDGGMTGMCPLCQANVSSFWPDVSTFRANVSSFWRNVFSFAGDVSTLARNVSSSWRWPWLGMGRGRKARFFGSAALRSE